jgi:predicted ArsR family transcriptional regulator
MVKTRAKILKYLGENPEASAGGLARALDLTPANIRYHLEILVGMGQVQISGQRPAGGAGRPINLYNLSSQTLGENLEPLLEAFLESLEDPAGLERAAEIMASRLITVQPDRKMNRVTLYNQAVEALNQHNYHASWGARPEGPRIELRHCPYRDLALTHPRICLIDRELISRLCRIPMKMTRKRSFGSNPYSPCFFLPGDPEQD